jgi:cell division protein FtsI (penicillin-binding protein 3)
MAKKKHYSKDFRGSLKARLVGVSVIFFLYWGGLTARLFYLQIIKHDDLVALSEKQYARTTTINYGRGTIYDRNQNELARNIEMESVYVTPLEVIDKKQTAKVLASSLGLDAKTVYKRISSKKHFVWLKRKAPLRQVDRLKKLDLDGVGFVSEQKRFYPKRELGGGVLGFVGLDNQGLAGIEHFHHSHLKGTSVRRVIEKDARGRTIQSFDSSWGKKSPSHDVVLTIDEVIQFTAEYHLKKQVEKYGAVSGVAVVMDPHTGEIYAMANAPQFNPNNYGAYPPRMWNNNVVSRAIEPGSIFKPIVAAAAIDAGAASPTDIFFCENGDFKIGRVSIGEASNHKFGWLSLQSIIKKSSNIGVIKIAQKLGDAKLYDYISQFGFGKKIGIDLPGESQGSLRKLSSWSALSLASISFGHEIAVTPIQMAAAMGAIANGGKLITPHVTKAILKNGEVVQSFDKPASKRVISEKTSRQIIEVLKSVVRDGTGTRAAVQGFETAGKTGTAQKYDQDTRAYSKTDYVASFIGFAPADSPRIVVLVMIDTPKKNYWGGVVAAPVFRDISREVLRYLNVPSSEERVYIMDHA